MKRMMIALVIACVALVPAMVMAEEGPAAAPAGKDMTLKGQITKSEVKGDGGKATVAYVLTTSDGASVTLPAVGAALKIDEMLDADVEVAGKGEEKKSEDGKVSVKLISVTSIKKVELPKETVPPPAK